MKQCKRPLPCLLLVVVVLMGAIFLLSPKTEATTGGDYGYKVSNGKATILNYFGSDSNITIPSSLNGYPVVSVGSLSFAGNTKITSVTIPSGVTIIDSNAFRNCTNLTSVTIPDSVTTIGSYAFQDCTSLTSITIPDGVTTIGRNAFCNCSKLNAITIPVGVTTIDTSTFEGTNLTAVTIPDGVTTIGSSAFARCSNLASVIIPDSVTSIGDFAFENCNLASITIPDGITTISDYMFYGCTNLTSVIIPDGVTTIGDFAFCFCPNLTSVTIPDSVITVESYAFYSNGLTTVYYAGSQSQWDAITFGECNIFTEATFYYNHIHDYSTIITTTAPTCTEKGYTTIQCSNCDTIKTKYQSALGHEYNGTVTVFFPTCLGQGSTVTQCIRCDSTETTYQDALGHDYSGTKTVTDPSCLEQGNTVTRCIRCDSTETTYQDALGHDYSGTKTVTDPSCLEQGNTVTQCIRCDNTETTYQAELGHRVLTEIILSLDPLTVTNSGSTPFVLKDGMYFSNNHTNSSTSEFTVTAAYDCVLNLTYGVSSENSYDKFYIYLNDIQKDVISGTVTGKTLQLQLAAGSVVTFCYSKDISTSTGDDRGWVKLDYDLVEILESSDVYADTLEPDCTDAIICSYCAVVVKEALGHSYVDYDGKEPTCIQSGWEAYKICERCDYTSYVEQPALGHDYSGIVTEEEPTCTALGWTVTQCIRCDSTETIYQDALGHDYSGTETVTNPTCLEQGQTMTQCIRCDSTEITYQDALGHDYSGTETVTNPTCLEQGQTMTQCIRCDSTEIIYQDALGHSFSDYVSNGDATSTADGTKTAKCDRCEVTNTVKDVGSKLPYVASGTWGENVTWNIYGTVLTISGTGVPDSAYSGTYYPWGSYGDRITKIVVTPGITSIPSYFFEYCSAVTTISLPKTVTSISLHAFNDCASLNNLLIPATVTSVWRSDSYGFVRCDSLTDVYYLGTQEEWQKVIGKENLTNTECELINHCLQLHESTATCTEAGAAAYYQFDDTSVYGGMYDLDKQLIAQPETVPATGHSYVDHEAKIPTCAEVGWNAYQTCVKCDYTTYTELATVEHDYTADPTTCGNCGNVRVSVEITSVVLRPACSGLYFKGSFTFDDEVVITRYGIAVSLYNKLPVADDSDETSLYTIGENSVLISNILGNGKDGKTLIYARPYVLLDDGTYIYGDVVATNLKTVVEAIDAKMDGFAAVQKEALSAMYLENSAVMQDWLIPEIKKYV